MTAKKSATAVEDIGEPAKAVSWEEDNKVGDSDLEQMVNEVVLLVRGLNAKVDREKMLSVIDLAERGVHHGREFRQLFIQANPLTITIRLVETVKSSYGGGTQNKTLSGFQVPVYEMKSYERLYRRFFGFTPESNLKLGEQLVDGLKQTVGS